MWFKKLFKKKTRDKDDAIDGWSQEFEYREPKNNYNQQFSAIFVFEKEQFKTEDFQKKAISLLWDEKAVSELEKRKAGYKEMMEKQMHEEFPQGKGIYIHLRSSPYDENTKGFFDVGGDYELSTREPQFFYKKLGYRSVEFTNQISLEKMKDYAYVQANITYFKKIFAELNPVFGYFDTYDYVYSMKQKDPRQYVFGLTFYGKEMVEQIGKEKILSAPAYKVEEFPHGGIMLQIHENPVCYIDWPHRRKIISHLGLKTKKPDKTGIPGWLEGTRIPSEVLIPQKKETMVIVGLNADEMELEEDLSLFEHFKKKILPGIKSVHEPEFAFASWFNEQDTGLEAFVSGNMFALEYKVFVGEKVGSLEGFDSMYGDVDPEKIKEAEPRVKRKFEKLGFDEKPFIYFLDYHVEGE
ncbi:MAG: hypothetical protein JRL30_29670 [Deltaproteobacteria bacterium]|nr:hypothetical protein [Deltaproteobacteria bacterium]